jgi:hypothetical protein
MSEWQPIETAPVKRRVLVFDSWGDYWIAARCSDGRWLDQSDALALTGLIRWQELPEPPK